MKRNRFVEFEKLVIGSSIFTVSNVIYLPTHVVLILLRSKSFY